MKRREEAERTSANRESQVLTLKWETTACELIHRAERRDEGRPEDDKASRFFFSLFQRFGRRKRSV